MSRYLSVPFLIAILGACSAAETATTVRLAVAYDDGMGLERLIIGAGDDQAETAADHLVVVRLPDRLAGRTVVIDVKGLRAGAQAASGQVTVTPVAGGEVTAQVSLLPVCTSGCDCVQDDACNDGNGCTDNDVCDAAGNCGGDAATCNDPPDPVCIDGSTLRTFAAAGSCTNHACDYPPTDTTCPAGCAAGQCTGTGAWLALEVGFLSSCALRSNHQVVCWGDSSRLRLPDTDFNVISNDISTCGLDGNGLVTCTADAATVASAAPSSPLVSISITAGFACGIRRDTHALVCWGDSSPFGTPTGAFAEVGVGLGGACAIRTADAGSTLACWGGIPAPPPGAFKSVTTGAEHACAIRQSDGRIGCWGGTTRTEILMPPAGVFTALSAGDQYTCALRSDRTVACWGANFIVDGAAPAGTYDMFSAGLDHACARRTDGEIVCWGSNEQGQLEVPR
jgi:hypothetical protein